MDPVQSITAEDAAREIHRTFGMVCFGLRGLERIVIDGQHLP